MSHPLITAGLRIDVDTLRGTRLGVPNLLAMLARFDIRASFFLSVGPDNMGRHLLRLLRPSFLMKMLRTRAVRLYGWDILLMGTLGPGPVIGEKCAEIIRQIAAAGHEIGLHAWDHHGWQTRVERMDQAAVARELRRGLEMLTHIIGRQPDCGAAPAWRITAAALAARQELALRYNSDCRGHCIFYPVMDNRQFRQPQIPTTLPTYDEVIGSKCTPEDYNEYLLGLLRPEALNVLTIHAEAEGIGCRHLFDDFLNRAREQNIVFVPLGELLPAAGTPGPALISNREIPGRQGWVSCQQPERI